MKIDKTINLESEKLRLRIPTLEDITHIFSATKYEGFNNGMLWDAPSNKEELIESFHKGIRAWENEESYAFSIEDKEESTFLGRIVIGKTKITDKWYVGFWTHPSQQKKGVMTESLGVILKFGFNKLNAVEIEASHVIWNIGSEKVLKRNGFKFIKYNEKGYMKKGKWVDENFLAIKVGDWVELTKENKM